MPFLGASWCTCKLIHWEDEVGLNILFYDTNMGNNALLKTHDINAQGSILNTYLGVPSIYTPSEVSEVGRV